MVTRITGMADNHALMFTRSESGYWEAQVPPDTDDGMYIVTLWAWDEAGNSSYFATILMLITPSKITIEVLSDLFRMKKTMVNYTLAKLPDVYSVRWEG